jgi:acetoin utilization deacetylase AcuC-like enzyme
MEKIFLEQFPGISKEKFEKLMDSLRDPAKHNQRTVVFVAEDFHNTVLGFAFLSIMMDIKFGFLDYIAAKIGASGGLGSSLYVRVREEAKEIGLSGVLFECLPDTEDLCNDPVMLEQNKSRLKFYENFGAFPIIDTKYETPVTPDDTCPPFMVYDDLGSGEPLPMKTARKAIDTILKRKYSNICGPEYIKMVTESFKDDPVHIREPRYLSGKAVGKRKFINPNHKIVLVVNKKHDIHHVRERGYVEAPVRVKTILEALNKTDFFEEHPVRRYGEKVLAEIHDHGYQSYLKKVCMAVAPGKSVYPYVFPIRNAARPPKELEIRAGYYCIDTFTPLNASAYQAAMGAVGAVMTAAELILEGHRAAYALVRPPGHHAERKAFGGFCYFNSAAAAAQEFSSYGKTAILDIDYHHGNGQQDIFYSRGEVLTVSIHGHPSFAYPYFSGFRDETGEGEGKGANLNIPLPEEISTDQYRTALETALSRIKRFKPAYLVVCLGLDTAKGDPTGTWQLRARDFEINGRMIGELKLPTLVVQEGGYDNRVLGVNARSFFTGFAEGSGLIHPI